MARTMDRITRRDRHIDEIEGYAYSRGNDWRPAPVVYRRRTPATLRWRWAVLIIAALSTLCWGVLVLIMVWLLAAL